jgi:hypothetical protein
MKPRVYKDLRGRAKSPKMSAMCKKHKKHSECAVLSCECACHG